MQRRWYSTPHMGWRRKHTSCDRRPLHPATRFWVAELAKLSGSFGDDSTRMIEELRAEIARDGSEALLDHLRLCGAIPEQYGRDSSEEKLYSKYTDAVVSESFAAMGLRSIVVNTRSDSPDIRARAADYSLAADAKAFRLSRTAKNQKDFKVQAMDSWRGELDYTVLVCPIYQWPSRTNQVYQQAIARNVCLLSYAHIADNVLAYGVGAYNEKAFLNYEQAADNVVRSGFTPHESGHHIAQKPVRLLRALIELTTLEGQVVLDPFCGSGSTLVAAKRTGRHYIGFDNDADCIRIAKERLAADTFETLPESEVTPRDDGLILKQDMSSATLFDMVGDDVKQSFV